MNRKCRRTGCPNSFFVRPVGPGRRKAYCSKACCDAASPSARSISVRPDTWLDAAGAPK